MREEIERREERTEKREQRREKENLFERSEDASRFIDERDRAEGFANGAHLREGSSVESRQILELSQINFWVSYELWFKIIHELFCGPSTRERTKNGDDQTNQNDANDKIKKKEEEEKGRRKRKEANEFDVARNTIKIGNLLFDVCVLRSEDKTLEFIDKRSNKEIEIAANRFLSLRLNDTKIRFKAVFICGPQIVKRQNGFGSLIHLWVFDWVGEKKKKAQNQRRMKREEKTNRWPERRICQSSKGNIPSSPTWR